MMTCDIMSHPLRTVEMVRKPKDVTDAELSVMQILWEHEAATIREITDAIYPAGSPSDYATVKKLLARLEVKQLVLRDSSKMTHVFTAVISQDELIDRRLHDVAADLCDGSHAPLVMNLLKNREYSDSERKQLHDLFDELFGSDSGR